MFKSSTLLLCFIAIGCHAGYVTVSFIDKCARTDKTCMIKSAQKALPYFAAGDPSLGSSPLDPMKIESASYEGGGLSITFKDTTVTELAKCKVVEINRDVEHELIVGLECPVDARGKYTASGTLMNIVPVEGDGLYIVKCDDVFITVKLGQTYVDGSDGEKHWKVQEQEFKYKSKGNAYLEFQNLFNGDKAKAAPVNDLIVQNSGEFVNTIGRPLVKAIVKEVVKEIQIVANRIPAKELEL